MGVNITAAFVDWLAAGGNRIGQIAITPLPEGSWELRHVADAGREDLTSHDAPGTARHIANLDDEGRFRPLKTTPNLARGWKLVLGDTLALRRALDYFYPAMIGVWHSFERGVVSPVFLRETLGRQTGMYRVAQKVTDGQARSTIDTFCAGCLKHRLWDISGPNPDPLEGRPGELPLICHEACNLLIAEIRKVVKNSPAPEPATATP